MRKRTAFYKRKWGCKYNGPFHFRLHHSAFINNCLLSCNITIIIPANNYRRYESTNPNVKVCIPYVRDHQLDSAAGRFLFWSEWSGGWNIITNHLWTKN